MDQERSHSDASELEGGGDEQTWGQGEGRHEPTIPPDEKPATFADGPAKQLDDPDIPLSREDEGMDR